jgi:uncharacterized caspase-like protein/TolB-like protein
VLVKKIGVVAPSLMCLLTLLGCSEPRGSTAVHATPTSAPQVAAAHPAGVRRPHLWVLSIGVSQYRDQQLRLQYAAADAQAFADVLKRQEHGPLYATVHTAVLLDVAVTRESILQALDTFLGNATPVDVAVIFLAGHGIRTENPTAYYFLTADASPAAPHIAGLDMMELSRQLLRLHRNIPHMVVVLDTCHGGAVTPNTDRVQFGADLASALAPAEGLYILTAAGAGERSFELAAQQHGAFTYALLDGLRGRAAGPDGLITVLGLATHASQLVQELTSNQQRPYIAVIGEDLALAAHPERFAQVTPPPGPAHAARAAAPPQRERVAIRDFEYFGSDATFQWMHRALSEDVLTSFSELHQLDVYDETMLRFVTRDAPDVIDAAQRAGIDLLVQGAYWVQDKQLSVNVQVQSVRPLRLIATARAQGPVGQFAQLTAQLTTSLFDQLRVNVPASLAAQLRHPATTSLAARQMLTETEGGSAPGGAAAPGSSRSALTPGAFHGGRWQDLLEWIAAGLSGLARPSLAQASADPETALQSTLQGYRQALESKDLDALRGYYEEFPPSQAAALARYFNNTTDLQIEFSDVRIAIIGDDAAVSFTRRDRFTDHGTGEPQDVTVRITKRFTRRMSSWLIQPER